VSLARASSRSLRPDSCVAERARSGAHPFDEHPGLIELPRAFRTRDRARRVDALARRCDDLAGSPPRCAAQRALGRLAAARAGQAYEAGGGGAAFSENGGESWQPADEGRDRHYTWSVAVDPDDPELWYVSASTGPYAAHGGGDPQACIYRRRANEAWRELAGGLPEPLPAMPYAPVAGDHRPVAGLADGQIWESSDRGESWRACRLQGGSLTGPHALATTSA